MIQFASNSAECSHFQDVFWDRLVQQLVSQLENHFQDRLISTYVTGSVHRKEAVIPQPIGSDLDLAVIIVDAFNDEDKVWRNQVNDALHEQVPGLPWSTMPRAYPISMVEGLPETEIYTNFVRRAVETEIEGGNLDTEMRAALIKRAS